PRNTVFRPCPDPKRLPDISDIRHAALAVDHARTMEKDVMIQRLTTTTYIFSLALTLTCLPTSDVFAETPGSSATALEKTPETSIRLSQRVDLGDSARGGIVVQM